MSTEYESLSAAPSRAFSAASVAMSGADNVKLPHALNTVAIYHLPTHSGSLSVALPVA